MKNIGWNFRCTDEKKSKHELFVKGQGRGEKKDVKQIRYTMPKFRLQHKARP